MEENEITGNTRGRLEQLRALLRDSALVAAYAWDVLVGCRVWQWKWKRAVRLAKGDSRLARILFAEMIR